MTTEAPATRKHRPHMGGPRSYKMRPGAVEALLAPTRVVRQNHDGLPFSSALVLVKMLDDIDIRDCDHCADLRYAIIDYIQGLHPLSAGDVLYDVLVNGNTERHLKPGRPA